MQRQGRSVEAMEYRENLAGEGAELVANRVSEAIDLFDAANYA